MTQILKASEAVALIPPGKRIFIHGAAATPQILLEEVCAQQARLNGTEFISLHTMGPAHYAEPERNFRVTNLFVGENMRKHMAGPRVDYLPCPLSQMPELFRSGLRRPDVALIQVSPPDAQGNCSLGTSVDIAKAAVDTAALVIAQINSQMPRVHGDGMISLSKVHAAVEVNMALVEPAPSRPSPEELKIGRFISELIEDGATLQAGIGHIPDAAINALADHRHLGVHSEMWSNGILELIKKGAVDNSRKAVHPGKTVSGFVMGDRRLYDFIHDNPDVLQFEADFVNNPCVIGKNPKVVAINSAVEIDLTGQVCADSVGPRLISGVGGQMDFVMGASFSPGGKSIVALLSRTRDGRSKIVPALARGAGVVTSRAHVHYVVTEFGVAELRGKTLYERAQALINIAHPEDRDLLKFQHRDLMDGV